ncbi:hypothetical protein TEA_028432 [Camellia sinensis var. sinensis]|uniref:Disease resistance protein At4g27190-like leucine-rich repeats domain-containing protein n=1 Tax=Camellia sinensis var. sinensis TaxID=542762 RepID=A0A4S4EG80_CAMSN|nr:hypothetical protein TEA_028432 [Camellia sinensis var. sinensis]
MWKGPTQLVWLGNLTSVDVFWCHKLQTTFSLSIARDLRKLQDVRITHCGMMKAIVSSEGGDDKIEFPKLKQLYLNYLPSFTAIYEAMNAIELPQLSYLQLSNMPKLNCLCPASDSESNCDPIIQPLFNNKVKLATIENLLIYEMENLREIWPGELQAKLREMTVLIPNIIIFPQLSSLKLSDLPNLRSFCSRTCTFEGSLLKKIKVINCPKMEILPSAFQRKLEQQKAHFSTSSQHLLFYGKMEDSSIEITEENHYASHEATVQAIEAIS